MILSNYAQFRDVFGEDDNSTVTSIAVGQQAIVLGTASDVEVGDYVMVDMGDPNYEIVTVEEVTSTTNITATFAATHSGTTPLRILAKDGYRKWPVSKVRAGGFTDIHAPTPANIIDGVDPIQDTIDVYMDDGGSPGVPLYTWYVSQPGTAFWTVAHATIGDKTIQLSWSTEGLNRFNNGAAFSSPPDPDVVMRQALLNLHVYVMDSSGNICWIDCHKSAFTDG